jgi:hypothetical protein
MRLQVVTNLLDLAKDPKHVSAQNFLDVGGAVARCKSASVILDRSAAEFMPSGKKFCAMKSEPRPT